MSSFREELLEAIEEMAIKRGMDWKDVIKQAIELIETQKSYTDRMYSEMFRRW